MADVVVNSSTSPVRRSLDELLGARRPLPLAPPPSSDSDPLSDAPPRGTTSVSGVRTFIELKIFLKKLEDADGSSQRAVVSPPLSSSSPVSGGRRLCPSVSPSTPDEGPSLRRARSSTSRGSRNTSLGWSSSPGRLASPRLVTRP